MLHTAPPPVPAHPSGVAMLESALLSAAVLLAFALAGAGTFGGRR